MIPGGTNPMLLSAGGDGGYQISRSLRLRASASAHLSRLPSVVGNGQISTLSMWMKRGSLGSRQAIMSWAGVTLANNHSLEMTSGDQLEFANIGSAAAVNIIPSALFRDPTAWSHLVLTVDTTQAISANRVKVYINGAMQTSFASASYPTLNAVLQFNFTNDVNIARRVDGIGPGSFDGVFADIHWVDGQALLPSSFGQNDNSGNWTPKEYIGTYGTNGFHLDFYDPTSLTTLMLDRSGNGNNWTANNISLTAGVTYDSMLDVPLGGGELGNYCTWNPLDSSNNKPTNGNLRAGTNAAETCRGTITQNSGKWYYEFQFDLITSGATIGIGKIGSSRSEYPGFDAFGYGYNPNTGNKNNSGVGTAYGAIYGTSDIIGVAYDLDNGKIWWSKNGVWQASGDPATGTNPAYSGLSGDFAPMYGVSSGGGSNGGFANFGQRPFAYTPPMGFKALHTGNLFNPPVEKSTNGFVNVVDTKVNIMATLAAARNGWSAYVDIIKNRAAGESWSYRFSHLAGNEYSVTAGAVTYQVNRLMVGTDAHVGRSIRIGAAYGTAAGSVNHTSGATTTVTHNVGASSRQAIYLFPRAGGSVIKLYHADLTPGKMLDLCSTAAETTDSSISGVTSSAFTIGAGMATGTYDYLLLSEVPGFLSLFKFNTNGNADGPFANLGMSPKAVYMKAASNTSNHFDWDSTRSPGNPLGASGAVLFQGNNAAEGASGYLVDTTANGVKVRSPAGYGFNETGQVTVGIAVAATPFKNALAH